MRIVYLGTIDRDVSPRVRILEEGLRRAGIEVVECAARGPAVRRWSQLCRRFPAAARGADAVLVSKPGQREVPIARLLARCAGVPVVHDFFASLWINQVRERARVPEGSLEATKLRLLDRTALRIADASLVDTWAHGSLFESELGARRERLWRIPVGAEDLFQHREPPARRSRFFEVLWWGTFIPFHGVDVVIDAALRLETEHRIRFTLLGDGPTRREAERRVAERGLDNLRFVDPVPYEQLPAWLQSADLCLGTFGDTPTARAVVPKKVYAALAAGRPLVTGDGAGVRELLDEDCYERSRPGDPEALAEAILELSDSPSRCAQLGEAAQALHRRRFTPEAVGRELAQRLRGLVRAGSSAPQEERGQR